MKIILILLFVGYSACWQKITRLSCNTSGIIVSKKNLTCRLRSPTRFSQSVELKFEVLQKLSKLYVDAQWSHKSRGVYWRQLVKFNKLDHCGYSRGFGMAIPAVKNFRDHLVKGLPTLADLFKCPIYPKKFEAKETGQLEEAAWNMTVEEYKEHMKKYNYKSAPQDFITSSFLPNGVYRILFKFYNDDDQEGFTFNYQYETYFRMNDENF